jgi:hypothetical protein
MMELWNFKDTGIIFLQHWPWLLLALLIGMISGWRICSGDRAR